MGKISTVHWNIWRHDSELSIEEFFRFRSSLAYIKRLRDREMTENDIGGRGAAGEIPTLLAIPLIISNSSKSIRKQWHILYYTVCLRTKCFNCGETSLFKIKSIGEKNPFDCANCTVNAQRKKLRSKASLQAFFRISSAAFVSLLPAPPSHRKLSRTA